MLFPQLEIIEVLLLAQAFFKLFEAVLMHKVSGSLETSDLQFGF